MKHLFVEYETALKLKELGFDEPCFCYWFTEKGKPPQLSEKDIHFNGYKNYSDSNTIAPLYQQVIDWFEKEGLIIETEKLRWKESGYSYKVKQFNKNNTLCKAAGYKHSRTRKEAQINAINEAIIIKQKSTNNEKTI